MSVIHFYNTGTRILRAVAEGIGFGPGGSQVWIPIHGKIAMPAGLVLVKSVEAKWTPVGVAWHYGERATSSDVAIVIRPRFKMTSKEISFRPVKIRRSSVRVKRSCSRAQFSHFSSAPSEGTSFLHSHIWKMRQIPFSQNLFAEMPMIMCIF